MVRIAAESKLVSNAELDEMAERFVTWLRKNHHAVSVSNDPDRWAKAMQYLASAQQVEDRRAFAVSQALTILLGRTMDVSNPAFRNAAAAVKMTRALADSVRSWRASPEICSVIEIVIHHHRDVMRDQFTGAAARAQGLSPWWRWTAWLAAALQKFTGAAARAQDLSPWWRWTAWLAAAIGNHSFAHPLIMAGLVAPRREPWWQWTTWLWAAMNIRRPESLLHDTPERIHWAATVAEAFDEIANLITRVLYIPDRDVLAAKRRRGRPTDHLRRELNDTLAEGGLTQREIADLQLVVCAKTSEDYDRDRAVPITIPPLASRADELDQIISEYAEDAITELGARTAFLSADHEWVRTHSASSLPDIEKATLRPVAIRESRNLSSAAARLGMAPVSLARWIGRRKLPMHLIPDAVHAASD